MRTAGRVSVLPLVRGPHSDKPALRRSYNRAEEWHRMPTFSPDPSEIPLEKRRRAASLPPGVLAGAAGLRRGRVAGLTQLPIRSSTNRATKAWPSPFR